MRRDHCVEDCQRRYFTGEVELKLGLGGNVGSISGERELTVKCAYILKETWFESCFYHLLSNHVPLGAIPHRVIEENSDNICKKPVF